MAAMAPPREAMMAARAAPPKLDELEDKMEDLMDEICDMSESQASRECFASAACYDREELHDELNAMEAEAAYEGMGMMCAAPMMAPQMAMAAAPQAQMCS